MDFTESVKTLHKSAIGGCYRAESFMKEGIGGDENITINGSAFCFKTSASIYRYCLHLLNICYNFLY
jgi:hypothetical protein